MRGNNPYGHSQPMRRLVPPMHAFESDRLDSLHGLDLELCNGDRLMEAIGRQASELCGSEVGLVTVIDETEQRFLACCGWDTPENTSRDSAFCAYTILQAEPMVVENALTDPRFRDNPFVLGEPFVRFYAGAPIIDRSGLPLGSVCAVDTRTREVSSKSLLALERLACMASIVLETRRLMRDTYGRHANEIRLGEALGNLNSLLGRLVDRDNGFSGVGH